MINISKKIVFLIICDWFTVGIFYGKKLCDHPLLTFGNTLVVCFRFIMTLSCSWSYSSIPYNDHSIQCIKLEFLPATTIFLVTRCTSTSNGVSIEDILIQLAWITAFCTGKAIKIGWTLNGRIFFTTVPHPHGHWQLQELLGNINFNLKFPNPPLCILTQM